MRRVGRNTVTLLALAAVVVVQLVAVVSTAPPASAATADRGTVDYLPPVDGDLTDTFRPPATPYGAGNRGIDYRSDDDESVRAAAAGEVVFAGQVGGTQHVVVLHADGIRTSYSFLKAVAVRRGQQVDQGQVVGTATDEGVHFGARAGEAYVDPLVLLGQRRGRIHLVADDDSKPLAEVEERAGLIDGLRGLARTAARSGGQGAAWIRRRAADDIARRMQLAQIATDDLTSLSVPLSVRLAVVAARWQAAHEPCTPASAVTAPTPRPPGSVPRRIAVLVGGLGSATGAAAVLGVDTAALGYAATDVHQFSYRADGAYQPTDTLGDIAAAGRKLAAELRIVQAENPGVPVDVIAHSQGGLVARVALTSADAPPVATLVTLAAPHQGADLATAGLAIATTTVGQATFDAASELSGAAALDPGATSVRQLAESSDFLRRLPETGFPPSTRVVSVAARGDLVVPNFQSHLAGAANVVVSVGGTSSLSDHGNLPASAEATREIALALAGQPPTCRSLSDALIDEAVARRASGMEDEFGLGLAVIGLAADAAMVGPRPVPGRDLNVARSSTDRRPLP